MAISATGIGSGIDVESLVTQLVAAEGQPASNRLNSKEARLQADLSAYGSLKSALDAFQSTVQSLNNPIDFLSRSATSSNEELFTFTALTSAAEGSYSIEIEQLAQSAKVRTASFAGDSEAVVGTGTLDITLGSDTFQIGITSPDNTLADVRDAINNAEDNPGVTASIINVDGGSQLILTSDKIGASNSISITTSDDDGDDMTVTGLEAFKTSELITVNPAQDAIVKIDNQQVTRDSNSFSDVISGVNISLKGAEPGTIETLTVGLDKDRVADKVAKFVEAYNSLADTMAGLSSYNAETGAAGTLLGDSALRAVQSQVRQTMSDAVSGLEFSTLVDLGVTTNDEGKLEIDQAKLDEVISQDFTAISQFFASENGLAKKLDSVLDRYVASDGILSARTDGLQSNIDSIGDDRERLDRRLASLEARYRAQFTAMDSLVAQLQTLGNYLTQQLASLPGVTRDSN